MSLIINHNIPALANAHALNNTYKALERVQREMATGKRINSAKDDPSGISIATKLNARISSMEVARNNVADAQSLVGIAEGGLKGISDTLQELRKLSVQAKNDTLGADERAAIKQSIDELVAEVDDYVAQAQYNGIALIDGTADLKMQTGPDSGDETSITISQDYTASGLSIDSLDVSDSTNAGAAIDAIDAAMKLVDEGRTQVGALDRRFDSKLSFIDTSIENLTASVSRIEDADYAQLQAENMKLQTRLQSGLAAFMQSIQMPQNILTLLG